MTQRLHITSVSNPRIKRLLQLRKSKYRRSEGLFIAEGLREVERAFAAGLVIEQLYRCEALLGDTAVKVEALEEIDLSATVLTQAAYRQSPQGVLAVVRQPVVSLESIETTGLFLIAVDTQKPGNLGAMVRTAAAAGCEAVLATGPVDAFNPNAIRSSTGAVFSLPVLEMDELAALTYCQDHRIRLIVSTPQGGQNYTKIDFSPPAAVVIGPEDRGLDAHWLAAADERATIVMDDGAVDSLNASAAAAVLLFEARR